MHLTCYVQKFTVKVTFLCLVRLMMHWDMTQTSKCFFLFLPHIFTLYIFFLLNTKTSSAVIKLNEVKTSASCSDTSTTPTTELFERCERILIEGYEKLRKLNEIMRQQECDYDDFCHPDM